MHDPEDVHVSLSRTVQEASPQELAEPQKIPNDIFYMHIKGAAESEYSFSPHDLTVVLRA